MTTSDEFELGKFDPRDLTPLEWQQFKRHVIRNAHAARTQALRDLGFGMLSIARAAAAGGRHLVSLLADRAARLVEDSWQAYAVRRERRAAIRELAGLDDGMLKDIGLGRSEIQSAIEASAQLKIRELAAARSRRPSARARPGAKSQRVTWRPIGRSAA